MARHGSHPTPAGRVADVPVVRYMRLVPEGDAGLVEVPRILRDVRAGAPWEPTARVRRIASRSGTGDRLAERLALVRIEAERAGLLERRPLTVRPPRRN